MRQSNFVVLVCASMLVAGGVSFFIAPNFEQPPATVEPAPLTAANVQIEDQDCEITLPAKAAVLRQKPDSHYWGLADVDGYPVNFMVDTGASVVVLTFEDAKRMRLNPESLDYKWNISTAGGQTKGASVLLDSVRFGGVEIENVEAMILREGLEQNLLGMSFLKQLYSYEFRGKQLIIRQ
jgi:aspartyl protease family protein